MTLSHSNDASCKCLGFVTGWSWQSDHSTMTDLLLWSSQRASSVQSEWTQQAFSHLSLTPVWTLGITCFTIPYIHPILVCIFEDIEVFLHVLSCLCLPQIRRWWVLPCTTSLMTPGLANSSTWRSSMWWMSTEVKTIHLLQSKFYCILATCLLKRRLCFFFSPQGWALVRRSCGTSVM